MEDPSPNYPETPTTTTSNSAAPAASNDPPVSAAGGGAAASAPAAGAAAQATAAPAAHTHAPSAGGSAGGESALHCDHCPGSGTCVCAICDKPAGAGCRRQHCGECRGLPGPCSCTKGCTKPKYVSCEAAKHCAHCPGTGICQCGICDRAPGAACKKAHCKHCKGLPGNCACTHGCAAPHYSRCVKVFHCAHCRGQAGTCVCPICDKPAGAKCIRQHCLHCKGMPGGACACTFNCARPHYVTCVPQRHCPHCLGRPPPAICECSMCPRFPGVLCAPAHCIHCRGFQGSCACPAGCPRRAYVMCNPPGGAPGPAGPGAVPTSAGSEPRQEPPRPPTL